jgi:uncharacterized membrane protein
MTGDRRTSRLALALFLSLGVNLFLAGLLAGHGLAHRTEEPPPFDELRGGEVAARIRSLPATDQLKLRQGLRDHWMALVAARQAWRKSRQHAAEVLRQPSYDPKAMADAFAQVRTATTQAQLQLHTALVDALGRLSPESRDSLARAATPPGTDPAP